METSGINEVGTKAPEKQLPKEYIKENARNLMVTIHELAILKNLGKDKVIPSTKNVYLWGPYKEYHTNARDNGISNIELTENILKHYICKEIMLGPDLIAVTTRNIKEKTRETYVNTKRALNEVKQVMGHLSDNIKPTTA
jgi:hypothetical protein